MFVRVAPLKRLPKHFEVCDYAVPEELKMQIHIGQLVTIPFRKSKIFGLVLSLETESKYADKVKAIESIVNPVPFLGEGEVRLFIEFSAIYYDALGSLLESALPPLQKRKIQTIELLPIPERKSDSKKIQLSQYLSEQEHRNILTSAASSQTLILVPEIHRIESIAALFPDKKIAFWHSEMSPKQKFETWQKIRNGEAEIIIGTRSSVLLTFFDLKNIIIVDEEHKDHKSEEAAPRFSVKDIALQVAQMHGAQMILTSSHPSSETYYHVYQHEYDVAGKHVDSNKTVDIITVPQKDAPIFIDLKTELQGHKSDYFLSNRVQEEILASKKDVFVFLNRRGSATSIYCQSCGYKDLCPTCQNMRVYHESDRRLHCHYCKTLQDIPLQCPKCRSDILQLRGYGTEHMETTLQKLTGAAGKQIIRMDSDVAEKLRPELLKTPGQKIIVGTEMSFQYLDWDNIGLLVCANLDRLLTVPEYSAEERLWHVVQYLQSVRPEDSQFYIQTHNPEHAFWKTLRKPDLFYRTDLQKRKAFSYPPYSYLVKYMYGGETSAEAKQKSQAMREKMAQLLTKLPKKAIVYDSLELYPHFYRKKYWYGIIVLLDPKTAFETIAELNKLLDEKWKVDPRPNSILDP